MLDTRASIRVRGCLSNGANQTARAGLRERWSNAASIDAETRRDIVNEALPHIETQIALVASRRAALEALEDELTEKRRRVREILLELDDRPA